MNEIQLKTMKLLTLQVLSCVNIMAVMLDCSCDIKL